MIAKKSCCTAPVLASVSFLLKMQRPVSQLVVAGALYTHGRVLIARRLRGEDVGKWEFPGGKVEPWENPEAALVRELNEELGVEIAESALFPLAFASVARSGCPHLVLLLYGCHTWAGSPRGREGQEIAWVNDLEDIEMPAADLSLIASVRAFLAEHRAN